jgi:hypothetical protein
MIKSIQIITVLLLIYGSLFAQSAALNALKTDAVGDFAYPLTPNAAGIPEGTVELWFSTDNWSASQQIWGGGNGLPGTNGDWTRLGTHSSVAGHNLAFGRYSGIWRWASSGIQPLSGVWYHVAATWGPAGLKIYLNGTLAGQDGFSGDLHNYNTELIAASSWGDSYAGAIDELRVWNLALDSSAIAKILFDTLGAAYYATTDSGLIAYYRMDEFEDLGINSDGADDIRDLSINANHLDTEGSPTLISSDAFILTDINDSPTPIPNRFELIQNYPNPFNPATTIEFIIPNNEFVTLKIYDITGREIATIVSEKLASGNYEYYWDAGRFASGVYLYRLKAGTDFIQTKKLILLK